MKKIIYCLLVSVLLILSSCKKENNPTQSEQTPTETLFPLAVGNTWQYIDTTFNSDGSIMHISNPQIFKVSSKTTIKYQGKDLEVYVWGAGGSSDDYLRSEADGIYEYNPDPKPLRVLYFKHSFVVGEKFRGGFIGHDYFSAHGDSAYIAYDSIETCMSNNEIIKTPAGTFNCTVLQHTTSEDLIKHYYAKNIGEVYYQHFFQSHLQNKRTLVAFTIK